MIDATNPNAIRSRIGNATASFYPGSERITLVADKGDSQSAKDALIELRDHCFASGIPGMRQ